VPTVAIQRGSAGSFVYAVKADGTVDRVGDGRRGRGSDSSIRLGLAAATPSS